MTCDRHYLRLGALASLAAACSSPLDETPFPTDGPFVVSNSVPVGSAGPAAFRAIQAADPVVYVSLVPGSLPGGRAVSIQVDRTGAVVSTGLVSGGLDPVAVPAQSGDTLSLTVSGAAGTMTFYRSRVLPRRPPKIVRTNPQKNKRDVPLNTRIEVVFSEPIDAALTPQDLELRSGGNAIPGQLRFQNPEHTVVEFTPAAILAPRTQYEIVVRTSIRDVDGASLEVGAVVPFVTTEAVASQLAFVRDDQIHLINSDGTGLIQLTQEGLNRDPSWSADGQRLAFTSDRGGEWDIYVMDADGSNVVRRTGGGYNVEPTWVPGGNTIAYTSLQQGSAGVWVIDADGEPESRVLLDRPGWDAHPAWSPDGRKLTFTSDWRAYDILYDLYVVDVDGSNTRPLLEGSFFWVDTLTFYFQSAWSPDGQAIAVVLCGYAFANCYPDSDIAVANADGSGLRVIARAGGYSRPAWSPDGRTIAFAASRCGECQSSLRLVSVDGGAQVLIAENGHSPAWRPCPSLACTPRTKRPRLPH